MLLFRLLVFWPFLLKIKGSFVFDPSIATPIKEGDFSEYYEFFYVDDNGAKRHHIALSKYKQHLDDKNVAVLYENDDNWPLHLFFVPNVRYLIEISPADHFSTFDPIYSPKHKGYRKMEIQVEKNMEKAFIYKNLLIYNNNGDTLDATSFHKPKDNDSGLVELGSFNNIDNITEFDTFTLNKIRHICFADSNEFCVVNSTDSTNKIIVETVPAVYHINDLSLYFVGEQDRNFYVLKDRRTQKHYTFPIGMKTFEPNSKYQNTQPDFRLPILTNLNDPYFKKYR